MKKITLGLLSAMAVLSLAACTPTPEKQAETAETFETQAPGGAEDKVPDPNAPTLSTISIYALNDDNTGLVQEMDGVETLDAQSVLAKLIDYGVLPEDTLVLGFYIPDENGGAAEEPASEEAASEGEDAEASSEDAEAEGASEDAEGAEEESAEESVGPDVSSNTPEFSIAVLNISQLPEENRDLILVSLGNTFTENFGIETLEIQVMDETVAEVSYNDGYQDIQ